MMNLLKILTGKKLSDKKLKLIKNLGFLSRGIGNFLGDRIIYISNESGIIISQDRTKLIDRKKWQTEEIRNIRKYNREGLLISEELFVISNYPSPPYVAKYNLINYNFPGSFRRTEERRG